MQMPYIKPSALLVVICMLSGCGLAPLSNSNIAVIRESKEVTDGEYRYQVILTGKGRPLVHDPVSILIKKPYEFQHEIFTNSISGRIESSSLVIRPVKEFSTTLNLLGYLEFSGETLSINMTWPDNSEYTFNGKFTIERKMVNEIPRISILKKSELNQWEVREKACLAKKNNLTPQEYCRCLEKFFDVSTGRCSNANANYIQRIVP